MENTSNNIKPFCEEIQPILDEENPIVKDQDMITFFTLLPEIDSINWVVKNFASFRRAAKVSNLPPLSSPEFGRGCRMRLWPYDKEHLTGRIDIAPTKLSRAGLIHFSVSVIVVEKDVNKVILEKLVDVRVLQGRPAHTPAFRLSRKDFMKSPKYQHLIQRDSLSMNLSLKYFPFDAPIFRGPAVSTSSVESYYSLLRDVEDFCHLDKTQNVHLRCGAEVFPACRFLLIARSPKMRSILEASLDQNPKNPVLTVKDLPPRVFEQMLQYIHTDSCEWMEDESSSVSQFLSLFEAAEKYQLKSLLDKTSSVLISKLSGDCLIEVWEMAEKLNYEPLKKICNSFMDTLPGSHVAALMKTAISPSVLSTPRTCSLVN